MSTDSDPPVTLLLSIFILVFFSIGFCSIYFYQCFMGYVAILRGNAMQRPGSTANGLDPSIIATFPTFIYSTMKDLRQDKCSQECAVCLLEFQDDDVLRFLTICSHVFHSECIGLWFESHTTCPICRRSLDPSQKSSEKSPNIVLTASTGINQQQERELEEEEEEEVVVVERGQSHGSASAAMVERFSRSHSTGHSILQIGAEEERFSLRLPEKVKERIRRGHSWRRSCISVGDFSSNVAARNDGMTQLSRFSGGDVARV